MSIEICVHVEIKVEGRWEHWSVPRIQQDLELFARIAGVRLQGEIEPIVQPRGMPDDCTYMTEFSHVASEEDCNGHAPGWLTAAEAGELRRWHEENRKHDNPLFGLVLGGHYVDGHLEPDAECDHTDCRVIFWFEQ